MSIPTPERFGPYVILGRIGGGGMAEIFLAKSTGLSGFEKLLALKRILPKYGDNPAFTQLLIQEAKLAAQLHHQNVVQVYDLGEVDGQTYIAMELIRGLDLAAILSKLHHRRQRLPIDLSLWIITELLTGLDYAHRMTRPDGSPLGMIHRDISPQNVLISFEGEVKVTDFGIARVMSAPDLLLPGRLHGKYGYMSPEQIQGETIDQRSDVFSAGVVIWELLTGTRLFRGKDPDETTQQVANAPILPPSHRNPEVPRVIDEICAQALERDRRRRYQTVGALLGDLARAANQLPHRAVSRDLAVFLQRHFKRAQRDPKPMEPVLDGRPSLGQLLIERAGLPQDELELALATQRARGGRLGHLLIESGCIDSRQLAEVLAEQAGCQTISAADLSARIPDPSLLALLPREVALRDQLLPLGVQGGVVQLVVTDPLDHDALREVQTRIGVDRLRLWVAELPTLLDALQRWYPAPAAAVVAPSDDAHILLADGDPHNRAAIQTRLQEEGLPSLVTDNGVEALRLFKQHRPGVLLIDAALPGLDGFNLLLEVRAEDEDAAVFLMSSRDEESLAAKAHELGADAFIRKPVRLDALTAKLRRSLRRRVEPPRAPAPVTTRGDLIQSSALQLIQSLALSRGSGTLALTYHDGRSGTLYLSGGRLLAAHTPTQTGEPALYNLLHPGPGSFQLTDGAPLPERNLPHDHDALVRAATRPRTPPPTPLTPTPLIPAPPAADPTPTAAQPKPTPAADPAQDQTPTAAQPKPSPAADPAQDQTPAADTRPAPTPPKPHPTPEPPTAAPATTAPDPAASLPAPTWTPTPPKPHPTPKPPTAAPANPAPALGPADAATPAQAPPAKTPTPKRPARAGPKLTPFPSPGSAAVPRRRPARSNDD